MLTLYHKKIRLRPLHFGVGYGVPLIACLCCGFRFQDRGDDIQVCSQGCYEAVQRALRSTPFKRPAGLDQLPLRPPTRKPLPDPPRKDQWAWLLEGADEPEVLASCVTLDEACCCGLPTGETIQTPSEAVLEEHRQCILRRHGR